MDVDEIHDPCAVRGRQIESDAAMKFAKNILLYLGLGVEDAKNKKLVFQKNYINLFRAIIIRNQSGQPFSVLRSERDSSKTKKFAKPEMQIFEINNFSIVLRTEISWFIV